MSISKLEQLFEKIIFRIEKKELSAKEVEKHLKIILSYKPLKSKKNTNIIPRTTWDKKTAFAKELGYKSVADAFAKMGRVKFEDLYKSNFYS